MTNSSKSPRNAPEAGDNVADAEIVLEEPGTKGGKSGMDGYRDKAVWMRGLHMLIIAVMMSLAGTILGICAVLQFGWLLFTGRRNDHIAGFGADLGDWLGRSARFQTATSDDKPFPWTAWGRR